jgi:beta-lactamase class C
MLDRALGLPEQRWLDVDFDEPSLYVDAASDLTAPGSAATKATAAPH